MKKYRDTLIHNIHKQLEAWFDQTGPIPHEELYRFLHSLKGTAGTIGLQDLADVAQVLLDQLESLPPKDWKSTECQQFILTRSSFLTTKSMNSLISRILTYYPRSLTLLTSAPAMAVKKDRSSSSGMT
ncbi:hypothetical protein EDM52_16065 [Brevibacillus invocatus]|uniref:HPt domain-containing protein n=1 Tax=Brevibacillus invocatus TaxID=173959 RepID=A0A3M8C666_9BACL|nr:hypothetical protein EDM52_16065 [Brevibacillus invocatus]